MTILWGLRIRGVNYVDNLAEVWNTEMLLSFKNLVLSICAEGALSCWNSVWMFLSVISTSLPWVKRFQNYKHFSLCLNVFDLYIIATLHISSISVLVALKLIFFSYLYCFFNARVFVWRIRRFSVACKLRGWMQTSVLIYYFVISLIDEGGVGIFFLPLLLEW